MRQLNYLDIVTTHMGTQYIHASTRKYSAYVRHRAVANMLHAGHHQPRFNAVTSYAQAQRTLEALCILSCLALTLGDDLPSRREACENELLALQSCGDASPSSLVEICCDAVQAFHANNCFWYAFANCIKNALNITPPLPPQRI